MLLERAGPNDGVDMDLTAGDGKLFDDMLPGMPAVEGVSLRGGRSVGGRGAGPGFMNWAGPYTLRWKRCSQLVRWILGFEYTP